MDLLIERRAVAALEVLAEREQQTPGEIVTELILRECRQQVDVDDSAGEPSMEDLDHILGWSRAKAVAFEQHLRAAGRARGASAPTARAPQSGGIPTASELSQVIEESKPHG